MKTEYKLDNSDDLQVGDVVAHFKREISDTTKNPMIYLYIIESIAEHTETGEKLLSEQEQVLKKYYGNVIEKFGKQNLLSLLQLMKQLETVMSSEIEEMEAISEDERRNEIDG